MSVGLFGIVFDPARGQPHACTLPLRFNEAAVAPIAEWSALNRNNCVVAFRVDRIHTLTHLLVRLMATPDEPTLIEVRARAVSSDGAPLLPHIPPTLVGFGPGFDSGWCPLPFDASSLGSTVALSTCGWEWQFRRSGSSPWIDLEQMVVRVYVVLGAPTLPWMLAPLIPTNMSLPWSEVLQVACAWARTARDPIEAAALITRKVNALGDSRLMYDAEVGAPHYTVLGAPLFLLTAFLERLRGGQGMGPLVNCSDCAAIVSTFANILGADLWQSKMGLVGTGFRLNPILAIGRRHWSVGWGGFSFHEVAWSGACGTGDTVFDACLHTDEDDDPTQAPHRALLPSNQIFGTAGSGHYRDQIAAAADRALCIPQPGLRVRRAVVSQAIGLRSTFARTLSYQPAETARALGTQPAHRTDEYRFEGFFFGGKELPGWTLASSLDSFVVSRPAALLPDMPATLQLTNPARVHVSVWTDRNDPDMRLRVESIETASSDEARATLAQVITEIECPLVEHSFETGDLGYKTPSGNVVLFARGNLAHIVRTAGTRPMPVELIAARIDEWITTAGTAVTISGLGLSAGQRPTYAVAPARTWRRLRSVRATRDIDRRMQASGASGETIEYIVCPAGIAQ